MCVCVCVCVCERERERERERETVRQTDRQTDRDRDRETERDRERQRQRVTPFNKSLLGASVPPEQNPIFVPQCQAESSLQAVRVIKNLILVGYKRCFDLQLNIMAEPDSSFTRWKKRFPKRYYYASPTPM